MKLPMTRPPLAFCCFAVAAALCWLPANTPAAGPQLPANQVEFFESKVRPVLAGTCLKCHGVSTHKGGLRLESRDAALKGGDSGAGGLPGNSHGSPLTEGRRQIRGTVARPFHHHRRRPSLLGLSTDRPPATPGRARKKLGSQSDRRLRAGQPRRKGSGAEPAGRASRAHPPSVLRCHWVAADSRRGRRLRQESFGRSLLAADRRAPSAKGIRRALGPTLARRHAVCSNQRLRTRRGKA